MTAMSTSEARTRANRRNAALSTGPKTAAGKARSAQNARRHGLSTPLEADPAWSKRLRRFIDLLARDGGGGDGGALLTVARLRVELERIAVVKRELLRQIADAFADGAAAPEDLTRALSGVCDYERRAVSRLHKAERVLIDRGWDPT